MSSRIATSSTINLATVTMSFFALKLDEILLWRNPLAVIMGFEQYRVALANIENDDDDDDEQMFWVQNDDDTDVTPNPKTKRRRTHYARQCITDCNWWKMFICPKMTLECESSPDGRQAKRFRRMFRIPYCVFDKTLLPLTIDRWFQTWKPNQVDCWGQTVGDLRLKLLGVLFALGTAATQFNVSSHTNLSEEVHRRFFIDWVTKMSSLKAEYIYMPRDDTELKFVVGEYEELGLPGCIGSIDCVHIGWDNCPVQMKNMYTGKEGYPSIAYEVICTSRRRIQSVSFGHPGSRNDKHIVRTDQSVMSLLEGNGWFRTKAFECIMDATGKTKVFHGLYLISDGGYHRWPCFAFPIKSGQPGSASMKWSGMLESVRKDIECVFGILKKRFVILKAFNRMAKVQNIDDVFVTCCILHNILLEADGFLDIDLPDVAFGLRNKLKSDPRGDGMWITTTGHSNNDEDNIHPNNQDPDLGRLTESSRRSEMWRQQTDALIKHFANRTKNKHS